MEISIPGFGILSLLRVLLDYNGTLALDGLLIEDVKPRLIALAQQLEIYVVTGDTFGSAKQQLADIPCQLNILSAGDQMVAKERFIQQIGIQGTVAIGNGRNDKRMLERAELSIAVVGNEGCAVETSAAATILAPSILIALDLLLQPRRLVATLRS